MIRRAWRWAVGAVLAVVLVLGLSTAWLVATDSGTRWLLARVSPWLPEALQITEVGGTLLDGVDFHSLTWTDETVSVSVDQVYLRFQLLPLLRRTLRINTLDVRGVDVSVGNGPASAADKAPFTLDLPMTLRLDDASAENLRIATAGSEWEIEKVLLAGQLSGATLQIERLDIDSELGDVRLAGQGQLIGDYPATATATWELRRQDQPPISGSLSLRGDALRYEVEHELAAPYAVQTSGSIAVADDAIQADLENTWQSLTFDTDDGRTINIGNGTLRLVGTPRLFSFDGDAAIQSAGIPTFSMTTRGKLDTDRVNVESLSISNEWGRLFANGVAVIAAEPSWAFDIELSDLDPAVAHERLSGKLQVTGRTTGQMIGQQAAVDVWIDGMTGDLNGYPVDGAGAVSYANEQFRFNDISVGVGDNRIDIDGSYGQRLRLNAALQGNDLSQLGVGAAGLLDGELKITSDLRTFAATGKLNGESLAWREHFADTLSAEFDLPATEKGTAALSLSLADRGTLAVMVEGQFADDQWSGSLTKLDLRNSPIGAWTLREAAEFSASRSEFHLATTCVGTMPDTVYACGMLDYDVSGPLRFDATLSELSLAELPFEVPEGSAIRGVIGASVRGEWVSGRLQADASLQINDLGLDATFEGDAVTTNFERAIASAAVVDNRLVGEFELRLDNETDHVTGNVEIGDLFDLASPLLGQGSLELKDLSLLSFFYPDVAKPAGRIFSDIRVGGSLLSPELVGEAGLSQGSVDVRRAGISVTDIELLLRQREAGQLTLQGSARSGEGRLELSGDTLIGANSGIRTEIRVEGDDFALLRLPDWQLTASPSVTVLLDERATRVSGELAIPKASISVHTVPETTEQPSSDVVVYRGEQKKATTRRQLHVDVNTILGEEVFFSGFGLTTGLEGAVRIAGGNESPYKSSGRVVLRDGRYKAYGQSLDIESGELIFNGPLTSPSLNVRATRTASDNTVAGIHLTGTPEALSSRVYSEPALADAEALSYLLTGRPLASANAAEGDMLNQAAFSLGLSSAGNVVSRIRNELGLDTLGVQGDADNRQLFAGKRLGDRLFIEYAYGVVDSLGTLLLRYQLNRRLAIESRSGSTRLIDVIYSVKKP